MAHLLINISNFPAIPNPNPNPNPNPGGRDMAHDPNSGGRDMAHDRGCFSDFLTYVFIVIFGIIIIALPIILVLCVRTSPPHYNEPPEFWVSAFNLSTFTLSSSTVSTTFALQLTARNPKPDKYDIRYVQITASVFYGMNQFVDESILELQPHPTSMNENEEIFGGQFVGIKKEVAGDVVRDEIRLDIESGVLHLEVRAESDVLLWGLYKYKLMVVCEDISVRYNEENQVASSMIGPLKLCKVQTIGIKDRYIYKN